MFFIVTVPKIVWLKERKLTAIGSGTLHRHSLCRQSFRRQTFCRQSLCRQVHFTDRYTLPTSTFYYKLVLSPKSVHPHPHAHSSSSPSSITLSPSPSFLTSTLISVGKVIVGEVIVGKVIVGKMIVGKVSATPAISVTKIQHFMMLYIDKYVMHIEC